MTEPMKMKLRNAVVHTHTRTTCHLLANWLEGRGLLYLRELEVGKEALFSVAEPEDLVGRERWDF